MIVALDDVKTHLRVQHDEENEYLTDLIRQAQAAASDYCRISFEPYVAMDGEGQRRETDVPEPVRLAVLLMVGFYFENREIQDKTGYQAMRMAFESLLYPYRDPAKMF